MRKVTIVVPVLMTSCHVSEKPNSGPDASQIKTVASASVNAAVPPAYCVALWEIFSRPFTFSRFGTLHYLQFADRGPVHKPQKPANPTVSDSPPQLRRGGCAVKQMLRSSFDRRRRGGVDQDYYLIASPCRARVRSAHVPVRALKGASLFLLMGAEAPCESSMLLPWIAQETTDSPSIQSDCLRDRSRTRI